VGDAAGRTVLEKEVEEEEPVLVVEEEGEGEVAGEGSMTVGAEDEGVENEEEWRDWLEERVR